VSGSCRTRIPGWSNLRVYWTNAVGFRFTWEHLGSPATDLAVLTTIMGGSRSAGNNTGCGNDMAGSDGDIPGSSSNYSRAVGEKHHLVWECCWCI
jgi:hypothetical protein